MDTIPWGSVGIGSGWALVVLFVVMLFKGLIVTRREHDAAVSEAHKQVDALLEINKHLSEQNSVLLNSAIPTVNRVLLALGQAAEGDRT